MRMSVRGWLPLVRAACDNALMSVNSVTIPLPAQYSLRRSFSSQRSGRHDPTLRVAEDRVNCGMLTSHGPVTVTAVAADLTLQVRLEGAGADWLEPHLSPLFGLQDDPSGFAPTGAVLRLMKRSPGIHLVRLPVVFHRLIRIVLHQLVTWEEAAAGWQVMTQRYGEEAPGESGLMIGPSPATLNSLAYYDLVDCGILPRQARLILKLAAEHRRIEKARAQGDEQLIRFLSRISGIGEWTLQTLRGSALADPDAVVTGDYGLPHTVCWFFRKQARGTDEEMLQLLEPFRGHRYRVQQLLMQSGIKPPRRGPKLPVRTWK